MAGTAAWAGARRRGRDCSHARPLVFRAWRSLAVGASQRNGGTLLASGRERLLAGRHQVANRLRGAGEHPGTFLAVLVGVLPALAGALLGRLGERPGDLGAEDRIPDHELGRQFRQADDVAAQPDAPRHLRALVEALVGAPLTDPAGRDDVVQRDAGGPGQGFVEGEPGTPLGCYLRSAADLCLLAADRTLLTHLLGREAGPAGPRGSVLVGHRLHVASEPDFVVGDRVDLLVVELVVVLVDALPAELGHQLVAQARAGVDVRGAAANARDDADLLAVGVDYFLSYVVLGDVGSFHGYVDVVGWLSLHEPALLVALLAGGLLLAAATGLVVTLGRPVLAAPLMAALALLTAALALLVTALLMTSLATLLTHLAALLAAALLARLVAK